MNKICVLGLGYVGLPTALIASEYFDVLGVDINNNLISNLKNQTFEFEEEEVSAELSKALKNRKISFSNQPKISDVFIIAVPTPINTTHKPSLDFVFNAVDSIIEVLKPRNLIIIESTCPIGTTEKIKSYLSKKLEFADQIFISYCPERVLPGNTIYEIKNNDRIIGGICEKSTKLTKSFYSKFVKGNLNGTNSSTAEACKLVENSYRDFQIAFANELSILFHKNPKIDVFELIELANKHPRINILSPGVGVGGHCIAVDPYFLIDHEKDNTKLLQLSRKINLEKTEWVINECLMEINKRITSSKNKLNVCVFGITYKPNSSDLRESPALKVLNEIASKKLDINLSYCDPWIKDEIGVTKFSNYENLKKIDYCIICVAHDVFLKQKFEKIKSIDFTGKINLF